EEPAPAVVAADGALGLAEGDRKADLEARGDPLGPRHRREHGVEVRAVAVAARARPEHVALAPARPLLLVLEVIDEAVVGRARRRLLAAARRRLAHVLEDRVQRGIADRDLGVGLQPTLRGRLVALRVVLRR